LFVRGDYSLTASTASSPAKNLFVASGQITKCALLSICASQG